MKSYSWLVSTTMNGQPHIKHIRLFLVHAASLNNKNMELFV